VVRASISYEMCLKSNRTVHTALKTFIAERKYLKRFMVVQNLKIAESCVFIFSKLFD